MPSLSFILKLSLFHVPRCLRQPFIRYLSVCKFVKLVAGSVFVTNGFAHFGGAVEFVRLHTLQQ